MTTNDADRAKESFKCRTALKYKIPVVSVGFLHECLDKRCWVNPESYYVTGETKSDLLQRGLISSCSECFLCHFAAVLCSHKEPSEPSLHLFYFTSGVDLMLVADSSSWALRFGSVCKRTHKRRFWEICLSGALQKLDLVGWLIAWLIDLFIYWSKYWFIYLLTYWLIYSLIDFIDWLIDLLIYWLILSHLSSASWLNLPQLGEGAAVYRQILWL